MIFATKVVLGTLGYALLKNRDAVAKELLKPTKKTKHVKVEEKNDVSVEIVEKPNVKEEVLDYVVRNFGKPEFVETENKDVEKADDTKIREESVPKKKEPLYRSHVEPVKPKERIIGQSNVNPTPKPNDPIELFKEELKNLKPEDTKHFKAFKKAFKEYCTKIRYNLTTDDYHDDLVKLYEDYWNSNFEQANKVVEDDFTRVLRERGLATGNKISNLDEQQFNKLAHEIW